MKQHAPATARNREPIRDVLERELPASGLVLEIASGSGEHAVFFAQAFPSLTWQPSDPSPTAIASIAAHAADAALPNLATPLQLDITTPCPLDHADAIVCINMIHISPWEATLALFATAARLLPENGLLYTYGPYLIDGETAPSNREFDASLRARDARWGVRDIRDLTTAATAANLTLRGVVSMPANNHSLLFRRN